MSVTAGVIIGGLIGAAAGKGLSYLDAETSGDNRLSRKFTTIAVCTAVVGGIGAGIGGFFGPAADGTAVATTPPAVTTTATPEDEARAALETCVGGAVMGRTIIIKRNPQGRMACTLE